MTQETKLLKNYLQLTASPTFNDFLRRKQEEIETISINIVTDSALQLQRLWVQSYNEAIQIQRPEKKLQARPSRVCEGFKLIFEIARAKRKAQHQFKLSSINLTAEVLDLNRNNEIEETVEEGEEGTDEEGDEENEEEEEEEEEEKEEEEEEEEEGTLGSCIKKNMIEEGSNDEELKKLTSSSCVNMINNRYVDTYSKIIPNDTFQKILENCSQNKKLFVESLDDNTRIIINNTFDAIEKFQHDTNLKNVLCYIDNEKASMEDKFSVQYNLLCIVDVAVRSFNLFKNESKPSENSFLRKFEQIMEYALANTKIILRDGEAVCQSTKKMQIMNQDEVDYGRRIDLLVAGESNDDNDDIELCSIEFKKANEAYNVMNYQQSKNIRINACILNYNHLLLGNNELQLRYYDFTGRRAYMSQLFKFDDCYIAHRVGEFLMPKSLLEMNQFRKSMIQLYTWRKSIEQNNNLLSFASVNKSNSFALNDIANELLLESPPRSPRNTIPMKIFLSPSKGTKRTRSSAFSNEQ